MCSWDGALTGSDSESSQAEYRADLAARRVWRLTARPALCCQCGTTRSTTAHAARPGSADGDDRCIVIRKCETCAAKTPHAYLLTDGLIDADERQTYPALDDATEADLLELELAAARAAGIKVSDASSSGPILASVTQHLDDGEWAVFLDPDASSKRRRLGLQTALDAIKDARARKWFVAVPDPENKRPAVRFAVFADSPPDSWHHGPTTPPAGTMMDPDGHEPPAST